MARKRTFTVDRLVERLVQAEVAEAEALQRLDMRKQNRCADRPQAISRDLLARGEEGRAALLGFLKHELPLVRLAAAVKVFEWAPDRTVPALEELLSWAYVQKDSEHPGLRPMVASFIMGNVKFYLAKHYEIRMEEVVPRILGIEENPRPWLHGPDEIIIKIQWHGSDVEIGVAGEERFLRERAFLNDLVGASEGTPEIDVLDDAQYDAYLEFRRMLDETP